MADLLHKFAQVLLLLYCLTPTESLYKNKGPPLLKFSERQIATVDGTRCLAVWFNENCLLTAASCFDEMGKRNFAKNPHIDVKITTWKFSYDEINYFTKTEKYYRGEAIVHPHYKRKGEFTFPYDLAVVRVGFGEEDQDKHWDRNKKITKRIEHDTLPLCSKFTNGISNWQVFAEPKSRDDRMYSPHKMSNAYRTYAVTSRHEVDDRTGIANKTAQRLQIDTRKQFTVETKQNDTLAYPIGGPVFDETGVCVAGIVNIVGNFHNDTYITFTKVDVVKEWIDFTVKYLEKARDKREEAKIYDPEEAFWKEKKINIDPIGEWNGTEKIGETYIFKVPERWKHLIKNNV